MNIVKSKYTVNEVDEFSKREIEQIGKRNIGLAITIENLVMLSGVIISILSGAALYTIAYYTGVWGLVVSAIVIMPCWFMLIRHLTRSTNRGLYEITEKIMEHKNIRVSSVMSSKFKLVQKTHQRLDEMCEFLMTHSSARVEPYEGHGNIKVSYGEGPYNKYKYFQLDAGCIDSILKKDSIDCSILDKTLDEMIGCKTQTLEQEEMA